MGGKIKKEFCHVCVTCGHHFKSNSKLTERCHLCNKLWPSWHMKAVYRIKSGEMTEEQANAWAEENVKTLVESERARETIGESSARHCLFCGRMTRNRDGFCSACKKNNLHEVYIATGRTNGLNRKNESSAHVRVSGGWRGRPCGGGNVGVWTRSNFQTFSV